jgi:hypothetical protein
LCKIAVIPQLVDTLTVTKALSVTIPGRQKNSGGTAPRLFNCNEQTVFEGFITRPGKIEVSFYSPAGTLLGSYSSAALSAGWQHLVIPHGASGGAVWAKGIIIMNVELPDGTMLKQVVRRM